MPKCRKFAKAKNDKNQKVKAGLAQLGSLKTKNLSQAWLAPESKLDVQAELGSGSEGSGISELGLASAQT